MLRTILTLMLVAGGASAGTIAVGPDRCPVPADAAVYVPGADIVAEDLSPWRGLLQAPTVLLYAPVAADADGRLIARFYFDAETGEIRGFEPAAPGCEPDRAPQ